MIKAIGKKGGEIHEESSLLICFANQGTMSNEADKNGENVKTEAGDE